jgi:hypothetical protein
MVCLFVAFLHNSLLTRAEEIHDEKAFVDIRDWIENYLDFTNNRMDSLYESYIKHREFWLVFPESVWALSFRRLLATLTYADSLLTCQVDFLVPSLQRVAMVARHSPTSYANLRDLLLDL